MMWYGKYLVYRKDQQGKEVRRHRCVKICSKANTPKWKAEQMLREIILNGDQRRRSDTNASPGRFGGIRLVCNGALHSDEARIMEPNIQKDQYLQS
jgi:hypothetical protein